MNSRYGATSSNSLSLQSEDTSNYQVPDFRKNLHDYGKAFRDSNGRLQLESVQDYYKKQDTNINAKSLQDLEFLRREYVKRGGQNAEFLQNIMSMEDYFTKKDSKHRDLINNPNALHLLRANDDNKISAVGSYTHPNISQANLMESFQQEMQNHSMMYIRNQLTLPSSNPSFYTGSTADFAASLTGDYSARGNNNSVSSQQKKNIAGYYNDTDDIYERLNKQESQLQSEMSSFHPNSLNYQMKSDELQKVQVLKNDIEKSVIVQKIFRGRNNISQLSGNTSINPANRSILNNYSIIRGGGGGMQEDNENLIKEGFVIRFDFMQYIPPIFEEVTIHFGIFQRGQNLQPFLQTGVHRAEQESPSTAKCIVAEKRDIHSVIPHVDAIMYFEMHANERNPTKKKIVLRAWTMHEIFNNELNLNTGYFKLPFYNKTTTPISLLQSSQTPIAECNLFMRICYPNDPYLDVDSLVFMPNEYAYPSFHLRNENNLSQSTAQQFRQQQPIIIRDNGIDPDESQRLLLNDLENLTRKQPTSPSDSQSRSQYGVGVPKAAGTRSGGQLMLNDNNSDTQQTQQQRRQPTAKQSVTSLNQSQSSFYNQPYIQFSNKNEAAIANSVASRISEEPVLLDGVIVHVIKLERFTPTATQQKQQSELEQVKVSMKLFDGTIILSDSQNKLCEALSGDTILQAGKINTIDFEHVFSLKVRQILQSYGPTRLRSVYLLINLLNMQNASIGWLAISLFKVDSRNIGDINNGRFRQNMLQPPVRKAPFGTIAMKSCPVSELVLEFLIHDPDILENETKLFDTTKPLPKNNQPVSVQKIPLGQQSQKMDLNNISMHESIVASPRTKKSQLSSVNGLTVQSNTQKNTSVNGPRNLLIIEVDQIKNYTNTMSVSYDLVVLREQEIVNDEFGNPSVYHLEELIPPEGDQTDVILTTLIQLPLDLQLAMKDRRPGWQQYHILFKFVEVDPQDQEHTLGWYVHPLYKNNRTINQGKFAVNIYDQPIQVTAQINPALIKNRKEIFCYNVSMKLLPALDYNKFAKQTKNEGGGVAPQQQVQKKTIVKQQQRVYTAEVSELQGLEENVDLLVNAVLLNGDEFMKDDSGQKCMFQGQLKACVKNAITFLEEYAFEIDIHDVGQKYKSASATTLANIRLVLYFLTKEAAPKYWYFCPVFDAKGIVRLGTFQAKVYKVPFQRFASLDKSKLKESKATLKLTLSEGLEDQSDISGD